MSVIMIDAVGQHVGQEVTIRGWLRSRRDSGKLHFLTVRDGSGDLQAVVSKKAVGDDQFAISASLPPEVTINILALTFAACSKDSSTSTVFPE